MKYLNLSSKKFYGTCSLIYLHEVLVSCGVLELCGLDPTKVVEVARHLIVVSTLRERRLTHQLVTLFRVCVCVCVCVGGGKGRREI